MTSPFQTELSDRAAAHAREWEAAHDPSAGLVEVQAAVRRRRRGRGLLAVGAGAACVALVATVAYAALGRGFEPVPAAELPGLAAVEPGEVLVGVRWGDGGPGFWGPAQEYLVVDEDGQVRGPVLTNKELFAASGGSPAEVVTLHAYNTTTGQAFLAYDMPTAYAQPRYALLDVRSGVVSPVNSCVGAHPDDVTSQAPMWGAVPAESGFRAFSYCDESAPYLVSIDERGESTLAEGVSIDPRGAVDRVVGMARCLEANDTVDGTVVASCTEDAYDPRVGTVDGDRVFAPQTGEFSSNGDAPFVIGGKVLYNAQTIDAGPLLERAGGGSPLVAGQPVMGIAVIGDRLLVATGTDPYGGTTKYGTSVGLLDPATGDYAPLDLGEAGRDLSNVQAIPVA